MSDTINTPTDDTTAEVPAEDTTEAPRDNREARYRVERNEARAEAVALAARIESLQTRELERIASRSLANPADLLTLGNVTLADLLDDDGEIDPDKVQAVADEVLGSRPGLKPRTPAVDPSQGAVSGPVNPAPSWGDVLKG